MSRAGAAILIIALVVAVIGPRGASAQESGFVGRVVVEWLEHDGADRAMRLVEPFAFRDPDGKDWLVPKGTVVDGASIPVALWSFVGSPFVGEYRRASVVHDYYCEVRTEPWQAVHRMFFHASVAAGVPTFKAKIMYGAVRKGGPRWEMVEFVGFDGRVERVLVESNPALSESELRTMSQWIEEQQPNLDEIDSYVDRTESDANL